MRRLNRQVLAGGVVHPAGTEATDTLEYLITNEDFWTDDEIDISEKDHQEAVDGETPDDVQSERETVLATEVERLTEQVETLTAENTSLREQLESKAAEGDGSGEPAGADPDPAPGDGEPSPDAGQTENPAPAEDYSEYGVKELKAEVKLRNQGRETPLDVAEPGNKAELIAALVADDQARA